MTTSFCLILPALLMNILLHYWQPTLADNYDYVMHGRIFSIKHNDNQRVEVQASFGGLLLRLRGEQAQIESMAVDMT